MKQKLFTFFLALITSVAALYASNTRVGGIYYDFDNTNNTAIVTYRGSSYNDYSDEYSGTVVIPSSVTYNGTTYSVTSIGEYAFYKCYSLTSVTIPESVTSIGNSAFRGCFSLTSVTIPESVTSIGNSAFNGCSSLTSITIPNSVTSIGEKAFYRCSSLTSITIPNSVTSIGSCAFDGCSSLTSITCKAATPPTIGTYTFYDISTSIPVYVPCGCVGAYKSDNGWKYFTNIQELLAEYSIEVYVNDNIMGTAKVNYNTFCEGAQISASPNIGYHFVQWSDGVTDNPRTLELTQDTTFSAEFAQSFSGQCGDNLYWELVNTTLHITGKGEMYDYKSNTAPWKLLVGSIKVLTIAEDVTKLSLSFGSCSVLKSIVWNAKNCADASSLETAPFYAIRSQITSFTFGENVEHIPAYLCAGCYKLTSVTIPNSVTSIGNSAFQDCFWLTSVTIGESVTSIGVAAFYSCSSLTSVTIPNSVTSIGYMAFSGCSSLTSVTIGESVTSIGNSAFNGCSSLTSVTIKSNTIVSKDYSYDSNISHIFGSQVTEYIIGESVTSIGESAFEDCSSLTSVTIGESVTSIGNYAFSGCSALTSIVVKAGNTTYDSRENCNAIIETTSNTLIAGCQKTIIPNSVTSIGNSAFYRCFSLTSITCEAENPPAVDQYAFSGVSKSIPVYVPCGSENAYKAASGWNEFTNIQEPLAEYSIDVNVNDNIMGSAKVDKNTACVNRISATANYGYHFVHWSDGNTNNPRSLVLTQDTVLTAEFAINQYTVTTRPSHNERGTTQGDTTVNHLENVTISATANYGYHFTQWNDGNTSNPRQVQVTKDKTYTAYFDKNTYAISLSCNEEQGSVEGVTSAEYLDTVTISATPNIGYHFVQWSDGVTDNPRTLELTQDTTFSAEFAQSFSGQCGDNLYWSYDETAKTISITGSGKMYDYTATTQPWLLFKEQIVEVTTTNTVTSIGTSAFEGCARLGKISLGTGLEEIAANAFAGCTRLYDIYVYATYPPFAEKSSFANYNVYVYIPCEYQRDYILDVVWGEFKFIECLESEDVTTDGNVTIVPGFNDVTITWPTETGADSYTIVIKKGDTVFCTLTFNADGQLLNIAFAPGRDGNHPAQYAEQAVNGYRFTVTGLEEGTQYAYNITTKDAANKTIATYSGEFTTMGDTTTDMDNIQSPMTNCQKILRNGQLLILRDGVEYTIMGQEL